MGGGGAWVQVWRSGRGWGCKEKEKEGSSYHGWQAARRWHTGMGNYRSDLFKRVREKVLQRGSKGHAMHVR
jgi:hypothetical protein